MGGILIGILIFISSILGLGSIVFISTLGFSVIAAAMNKYYEKGNKDSI